MPHWCLYLLTLSNFHIKYNQFHTRNYIQRCRLTFSSLPSYLPLKALESDDSRSKDMGPR